MREFYFQDNILFFICEEITYSKDITWKLHIDEIKLIGFVNRMRGDEDSSVIVFVSKDYKKYFIDLAVPFSGKNILIELLLQFYRIDLTKELEDISSVDNYILYPNVKYRSPLYKKGFRDFLSRMFDVSHFADGVLSSDCES